jgi:YtkA-like
MARRAILATAAATLAALALPAASMAGGWATVGLETLPAGVGPGETWVAEAKILQHGQTPLEGVSPRVLIDDKQGGYRAFDAKPTGEPGVYRARVVFPKAGSWQVTVEDGFVAEVPASHAFGEFEIGAAGEATGGSAAAGAATVGSPPADDGAGISAWAAIGLSLVAGGAAFLLVVLLGRRTGATRPTPAQV